MAQQHTVRHPAAGSGTQPASEAHGESLKDRIQPLLNFWQKLSNDWVFNLSGLLAYNFLMSIFPILLALLAIAGFLLNTISPGSEQQLIAAIANALPGGQSGTGGVVVEAALRNLQRGAGALFIIGIVTAIFTGSRLFITLENCFGVIFRLRGRDLIRQNLMAIGMMLLYIVLVPIVFLASIVPTAILNSLHASGGGTGFGGFLIHLIGLVAAFVVALILFAAIYIVVPNRPVHLYEVWKGTLVAAGLLVLYEILFPVYESLALKPNSYGSVAAFAIVILVFFYYLAVILLLGAEINSWASGQRETASDIAAIMHEVQAHNTTRGAAGPTAGEPQEDLQNHTGAPAMATTARAKHHEKVDHRDDAKPSSVQPGIDADTPSGAQASAGSDGGADGSPGGQQGNSAQERSGSDTQAAPYTIAAAAPQPHRTPSLATRHEQWLARPDAGMRRRQTQRALGIAAGAGLATFALMLRRRRRQTSPGLSATLPHEGRDAG